MKRFAQSWTVLFRAFSSHRQPSASLTKLFPSWTRLLAELDKPRLENAFTNQGLSSSAKSLVQLGNNFVREAEGCR